jgi:hypothetical protein
MQTLVYHPAQTTLLTMISGAVTDQEWQEMYDALLLIIEDSRRKKTSPIIISFSDPSTTRPNATWRKKLAETRNLGDKSRRSFFVLVTSSAMLRGLMIAINWIVPKADTEENHVVNGFTEAYRWLQERSGSQLSYIPAMYEELIKRASGRRVAVGGSF